MSDVLTALLPLIEPMSYSVARSYPGVEADDIYQELALFVLQHGQGLDVENEPGCRYILGRVAQMYAGGERAAMLHATSQYNYRPEDVRKILETALNDDRAAWPHCHVPDDAKSIKGSAALEVALDIRMALEELDYEDYQVIVGRYRDDIVPEPTSAERKRLDKAVERLCEALNGFSAERLRAMSTRGFPGARRAMSNAQSQAVIGEAY